MSTPTLFKSLRYLAAAFLLALTLTACSSKTVHFVGESEPADFSLSFQEPITFSFDISDAAAKYDWAVELTYFPEQMQGWKEVPVYYIHTTPDAKETDGKFKIPIQDAQGKWLGTLQDNGHDYVTSSTFSTGLTLPAGKHTLKFYGDNVQQGQPILGIVRFTFKVLR